jgi:hypothetical protein
MGQLTVIGRWPWMSHHEKLQLFELNQGFQVIAVTL